MQNFNLLRNSGRQRKPVLLKRGISGHDRGTAAVGRVHPGGRQLRRDPVRARHPHLRDLHAQHHGHLGDPGDQEAVAPADHCRPVARHGPARQGGAHGAGRGGRRRRRPASSRSITIPTTRLSDGAQSLRHGAVRRDDAAVADHRAGSGSHVCDGDCAIVGVGLIGGSFGLALEERRVPGAHHRSQLAGGHAMPRWRGGHRRSLPLAEAAAAADVIYLAQPICAHPGHPAAARPGGAGRRAGDRRRQHQA